MEGTQPSRGWSVGNADVSLHLLEDDAGLRTEAGSIRHAVHLRLDRLGQVSLAASDRAQSWPFRPAASCLVPAGVELKWRIGAALKRLVIRIEPGFLDTLAAREGTTLDLDGLIREPSHDPVLEHCAGLVLHEASQGVGGSAAFVDGLAQLIGAHLVRRARATPRAPNAVGLDPALRARLERQIAATLPQPIVIEDLAAACGLSHYQLLKVLKRATGSTPQQFVLEYRVQLARKLLRESDLSLADIAHALGFSSQSHFSNTFKAIAQCTPKAYRERQDLI